MTALDAAPGHASGAAPALTITVYGEPAAQGSKKYAGHRTNRSTGRTTAVLIEQSKKVKPWRAQVTEAARQALVAGHVGLAPIHRPQLTAPLLVDVTFTVPKPARIPKGRRGLPATRPDLDKMLRALFDGITDSKVWQDDGLVVEVRSRKVYPGMHPAALDRPGAAIRIWEITS